MSHAFDDAPGAAPAVDGNAGWQPLPIRARLLFLIAPMLSLALAGAVIGFSVGTLTVLRFDVSPLTGLIAPMASAALGLLIGAGLGYWLGRNHYRRTFWRLDAEGLALRRGRMWQRETRVPVTRVQHLDLKRGPLQRRRHLATLTVHTAGTRNNAVVVPNIDLADAEHLRDRLGRQLDLDDED